MKLAVVGAGAMGSALAAEASLAGHNVHVVDVSREIIDRIANHGVEVHDPGGDVQVGHPAATIDASTVGVVDLVVLFVKAQHTRSATDAIRALRGAETVVLSLQNGWGNADILAEELGTERLVFGVTYNSCSALGPGAVRHSGRGGTHVGPYADDETTAAERAVTILDSSGWPTVISDDVRTEIWKKLILNAATLPTAALTGLSAGALGRSEAMRSVVFELTRETCAVARAMGLAVDEEERHESIATVLSGAGAGKASMLQDVEACRKTEIEVINAAVVRAGAMHGVPTPVNELMVSLIGGREESWSA